LWEFFSPKRKPRYSRKQRWPANLAIVAVDTILLRVIAPVGLTGAALLASENGWGLFHYLSQAGTEIPFWLAILVSIVALDIVIYWQHRLFHRIPL
ncbi:sterol desaturase family protein, partial [Psychrobacter sp. SIMBA_152]